MTIINNHKINTAHQNKENSPTEKMKVKCPLGGKCFTKYFTREKLFHPNLITNYKLLHFKYWNIE